MRFHYSFTEEGRVIRDYIVGSQAKRIGIIYSNDPSTSYQVDSVIVPFVAERGITVFKESFSIGNKDFSAIVQKIKAEKTELVYLAGYGNDMPAILTELHKSRMTAQNTIICGNIGFIELPLDTPAELYEGVVFTLPPFVMNTEDRSLLSFRKKYQDISGGQQIGYAAYYAYDMVKILALVLQKSSSSDTFQLRTGLVGEFRGICGNYSITPEGDVTPPVILGRYVNGVIIPQIQAE
jgi:branched-chain amino acid transport system substrate-binding protein